MDDGDKIPMKDGLTLVNCGKRKTSISASAPHKKIFGGKLSINTEYTTEDFKHRISNAFQNGTNLQFENGSSVSCKPYPHCILSNFITPASSVEKLLQGISHMKYKPKENDLYKFRQTDDLVCALDSTIVNFRKLLYEDFLSWMSSVVGCPLDSTVDLSCSCYEYTDYLLCHNDQWERRKIAFIYYLVPHWSESDGGTLDMFDIEKEEPKDIVATVVPMNNSFVFFEVTPYSYHQVREVVTDKKRIAISGWFHGNPCVIAEPISLNCERLKSEKCSVKFDSWINAQYLNDETIHFVRKQFIKNSEILLCDFLIGRKYTDLCEALKKTSDWKNIGPPNKRNLQKLPFSDDLPSVIKDFTCFLHSEDFLIYLSSLVGIKFHNHIEMNFSCSSSSSSSDEESIQLEQNPSFTTQIEKWGHRSYTVLHDFDEDSQQNCLDSILFFNCKDWDVSYGGNISYIAEDEDSSLLDVVPTENSLSLVYKEKDTMRCVKYLNHRVTEREIPHYNSISTKFYEN